MRTLSSTRGLLLGLLLRHHVRCRNQQLRQACICWAFGQRGQTVKLFGRPLPVLLKEREFRSRIESNYGKQVAKSLTSSAGRCERNPRSSVADAGASAPLNSTFQTSSYVVSKSPLRVWCCAGSNSHMLKPRRWHGRIRRMSMTWTTLTSLSFLSTSFWTQAWSPVSSSESPHVRPLSFQEVSRIGMPDLNSGAAAHLGHEAR